MDINYFSNSCNFESDVLNSPIPVLVIFSAKWCEPCQTLKSALSEVMKQFKTTNKEIKFKTIVIDIDDNPDITSEYGIRSIPTCIIFKNKEIKEICKNNNSFDLLETVKKYV